MSIQLICRPTALLEIGRLRSLTERENWPAWYAAYVVAEQAGTDLPT